MPATSAIVKKIVVGVDGSDAGKSAVEWTARMAKAMHSQVVAVYALDLPVALPDPYAIPFYLDDKWRAGLQSDFENKWCRPLKTAGVVNLYEYGGGDPILISVTKDGSVSARGMP